MLKTISLLIACCFVTESADLTPHPLVLRHQQHQSDFPALTVDSQGTPWVAYVNWDGKQDTLCLAKRTDNRLTQVLTLGRPGIIHQPALAAAEGDILVVVWSQVYDKNLMDLKAQIVRDGRVEGAEMTLAASDSGGNILA